jgi:hypothetical protein
MTAPTPKPEEAPAPRRRFPRFAMLAASGGLVFAAISLGLVRLLAPRGRVDYLIIGTLATLAAILTIFAGLLFSRGRPRAPSVKPEK